MTWQEQIERIAPLVDSEYMTPEKAAAIGRLWDKLQPKRILEIGTFKGTGACYLGAMSSCWGGRVTTVDLPWTAKVGEKLTVLAEQQVQACGLTNVTIVRRDAGGEEWLRDHFTSGARPLDFVYVDGGHTWTTTAAQFVMAFAALRYGGWICFDDLSTMTWPAVDLVWRKLVPVYCPKRYETPKPLRMGFAMRHRPLEDKPDATGSA